MPGGEIPGELTEPLPYERVSQPANGENEAMVEDVPEDITKLVEISDRMVDGKTYGNLTVKIIPEMLVKAANEIHDSEMTGVENIPILD